MKYTVYHGSSNNFQKFNLKKTIGNIFWFTDNREEILQGNVGASGRGFIYKCEVTINNPCGWEEYEKLTMGQIQDRGFDGIILPNKTLYTNQPEIIYIAFESSQIKILNKEKLEESIVYKILFENRLK